MLGTALAAAELVRRSDEAHRRAQAEKARREIEEEAKRAEFRSRIFERARETFDRCLAVAGEAAEKRGARSAELQLHSERFDPADFADRLNEWTIAVIALRENGLTAEYVVRTRVEPDEMMGGESAVHTPYIVMLWE